MTARTATPTPIHRTALTAAIAFVATAGMVLTHAAGAAIVPAASAFVPITPCRLIDTRPAPDNVGPRTTPVNSDETFIVPVIGSSGHCRDLPPDATAVSLNVTIIEPTSSSFLTVFPADAATRPITANLTWTAKQAPTPNAVTSALSADGKLAFYNLSGSVNLAVDVVGYYVPSANGPAGPQGPKGDPGPTGDPGTNGATPARVVWVAAVASPGVFTKVNDALASITDNDATHPYLIKVAPGAYTEMGGIDMKNFVDIEGSGQGITSVTCACSSPTAPFTDGSSATVRANGAGLHAEIGNLTVANTGINDNSTAIWTRNTTAGQVTLRDVTAIATNNGGNYVVGVFNESSSPAMDGVTATATGGTLNVGVYDNSGSSPAMDGVTATASGGPSDDAVYNNFNSSPTMHHVIASASGGPNNIGVYNGYSSSPVMNDVTVTATGSTTSTGVYDYLGSSPTMSNVTATASGATTNDGVYNEQSSPTIRGSNITGRITHVTSGVIRIYNSTLTNPPPVASGSICSGTYISSSGSTASCS